MIAVFRCGNLVSGQLPTFSPAPQFRLDGWMDGWKGRPQRDSGKELGYAHANVLHALHARQNAGRGGRTLDLPSRCRHRWRGCPSFAPRRAGTSPLKRSGRSIGWSGPLGLPWLEEGTAINLHNGEHLKMVSTSTSRTRIVIATRGFVAFQRTPKRQQMHFAIVLKNHAMLLTS